MPILQENVLVFRNTLECLGVMEYHVCHDYIIMTNDNVNMYRDHEQWSKCKMLTESKKSNLRTFWCYSGNFSLSLQKNFLQSFFFFETQVLTGETENGFHTKKNGKIILSSTY